MFGFSHWELLIILGIALLLFGRRLPEVGRSLGKGIIEFKKGLKGVEEELNQTSSSTSHARYNDGRPQFEAPTATSDARRVGRNDPVEAEPNEAPKA
ncbi:MAG: twin-arginine translocase TatA/TatE family subunit [Phycisphaerales bacterium]|jgi:TatA/E family protein of Tat protein translocase|nr:twin-arginine translocase TatA/TatE family subunit [Phycisphaerales bacterium]